MNIVFQVLKGIFKNEFLVSFIKKKFGALNLLQWPFATPKKTAFQGPPAPCPAKEMTELLEQTPSNPTYNPLCNTYKLTLIKWVYITFGIILDLELVRNLQ